MIASRTGALVETYLVAKISRRTECTTETAPAVFLNRQQDRSWARANPGVLKRDGSSAQAQSESGTPGRNVKLGRHFGL